MLEELEKRLKDITDNMTEARLLLLDIEKRMLISSDPMELRRLHAQADTAEETFKVFTRKYIAALLELGKFRQEISEIQAMWVGMIKELPESKQ